MSEVNQSISPETVLLQQEAGAQRKRAKRDKAFKRFVIFSLVLLYALTGLVAWFSLMGWLPLSGGNSDASTGGSTGAGGALGFDASKFVPLSKFESLQSDLSRLEAKLEGVQESVSARELLLGGGNLSRLDLIKKYSERGDSSGMADFVPYDRSNKQHLDVVSKFYNSLEFVFNGEKVRVGFAPATETRLDNGFYLRLSTGDGDEDGEIIWVDSDDAEIKVGKEGVLDISRYAPHLALVRSFSDYRFLRGLNTETTKDLELETSGYMRVVNGSGYYIIGLSKVLGGSLSNLDKVGELGKDFLEGSDMYKLELSDSKLEMVEVNE